MPASSPRQDLQGNFAIPPRLAAGRAGGPRRGREGGRAGGGGSRGASPGDSGGSVPPFPVLEVSPSRLVRGWEGDSGDPAEGLGRGTAPAPSDRGADSLKEESPEFSLK